MNRRAAVLTIVVMWLAAGAAAAPTRDFPAINSNYRITSWTIGDGIALGEVRSLAQDENGYLWIASESGLVRFDGFRFASAELVSGPTTLPMAPTRAVYVAHDGSLWVGYGDHRGIYRIVRGAVHDVFQRNEISGFVNVIVEDHSGAVWVGHDDGLLRFRDGQWKAISLPRSGPGQYVRDVHEDRAGTLWVATASGLYRRTSGEEFEPAPFTSGRAVAITEDAMGHIWTTDDRGGFRRADRDRNRLFEARGMSLLNDSRDNLWVSTVGQGIWQVHDVAGSGPAPAIRHASVQTGLLNDENSAMLEDRDGNIWIGSIQGVTRLTPENVKSIVDLGVVSALEVGTDGTAWAGTTTGLVAITGMTGSPGSNRMVSPAAIRALHTAAGTVWAATDQGLHRLVGDRLIPVTFDGTALRRITSIASDSHGALWICDDEQGLVRAAGGHLEHIRAATAGTTARPRFVRLDDADRAWIAFEGGTLRRLDADGRATDYGSKDGLSHSAINAFYQDSGGDIWIGGTGGLSRLHGDRFETLSFGSEVRNMPIAAVIDDDAGNLWIGVAFFGFLRVARDDVERIMTDPSYPLRYHIYNAGYRAGYPDFSSGGSVRKGANGVLWFLSSRGITVLNPRLFRGEPGAAPYRPRIEALVADSVRYNAASGVGLPPRTSRLRIDYTVVDLSSVERIRFRYRLDGFDTQWIDGTGPRQASYTNLPPGTYRFRVQSATNAVPAAADPPAWNEAETDLSFSIEPMFYQTRWFYVLGALAIGLCVVAVWQLRLRQVRKQLAMVFGERLRLSREIHDTLLQSLVGLALQLDATAHDAEPPASRTRTQLLRMRRQVEDYVREVRQSIWNLRSPVLDEHGLVGALRATGERLTAGKVQFDLKVSGTPRSCPANVETHVLRIGHEAIMNAIRHASAQQVQVELTFERKRLLLRVADDGRGFDDEPSDAPNDGHYGLTSMKERAADAGGRCVIDSKPGSGVEVVAEFPLASAS